MANHSAPARILCIAGARPNFMKVAPVLAALRRRGGITPILVHTGQHYDPQMSGQLFKELGLPAPDVNLEVGSGNHATQTAEIMARFDPVLERTAPACVLVVGDVNSTLACALVAAKRGVALAHVEAGLRSYDRTMPEEINRVVVDQLADLLFTSEAGALANLQREGIPAERVHFVGNVMVDTLLANAERAILVAHTLAAAGVEPARAAPFLEAGRLLLVTLHRPSNVDDPSTLQGLVAGLCDLARLRPMLFILHPRSRARLEQAGLREPLEAAGCVLLPPQGYLAMLGLQRHAGLVLTDSGGIQEETTALGIPCFTLRTTTERPVTVEEGTNQLVPPEPGAIRAAFGAFLKNGGKGAKRRPALWDGMAAERIATVLAHRFAGVHCPAADVGFSKGTLES